MNNVSLKNFTSLNHDEKALVLEWRNDSNIRKWMYNSDVIKLGDHLKFIDSLYENKTKEYFLVFEDDYILGVIYFIDINYSLRTLTMGLYSNPVVKGVGKKLMQVIINHTFEKFCFTKIMAEVYEDNISAISLYEKMLFKTVAKKQINNNTVLVMQLENRN